MTHCFHCGETVPEHIHLTATIEGREQPMCCIGCQAVAQFLASNDHAVFYHYRQDQLPGEQVQAASDEQWQFLDAPEVFDSLTRPLEGGLQQVTIKVEGMYCSACGWLLQKVLLNLPGIDDLQINAVTQNLQLNFDPQAIRLSEVFSQISALGYQPRQHQQLGSAADDDRKSQLKRIAVAGFGMMFIMTLAVPLYSPDQFAVAPHIQRFFLMISMLIATGVFFYSGQVFINNAIRDLKNRHLGMDVPVALSISLAYFVSIYLSFKQQGHVYFDSMTMFVFFLLLGRFVESQVRHKGMNVRESLFALIPVSARVMAADGGITTVPLEQVSKGQQLQVNSGEVIPCDGLVMAGQVQVNEALLTGESRAVLKNPGDQVYAGSTLLNGELLLETTVNNEQSFLSKLAELMERAQSQKPRSLQLVDQLASYFVGTVLLLAAGTATWYLMYQPDGLMTALLAVLIATCPCALSLATPTALTAAGIRMLRDGILVNNTEAITQLDPIKHWYFDKTGTLSNEQLSIARSHLIEPHERLDDITTTLQQVSNHPIASAFNQGQLLPADDARELAGQGVTANLQGHRWLMGSPDWLRSEGVTAAAPTTDARHTVVWLACDEQLVAVYELSVQVRAGVTELLSQLKAQDKSLTILSGDREETVQQWGEQLTIQDVHGGLSAADKINHLAARQQHNERCVMVGDGVNDAPVLSQADVSVSLKQGAHLAHSASDLIVLGRSLAPLIKALHTSHKTQNIIKQNLSWSLLYNLSITPVAMMGLLAPWMAAIGMSLSSLLVVLNSRRLLGRQEL
jgi:Cu2+-exporting ATPase